MPNRPDLSNYLAHFTKNGKDGTNTAFNNLVSILKEKKIFASSMPWTNSLAACFTECPWTSLIDHARRYSPYGVGFDKGRVFAAGGAPAYYVRCDYWETQGWKGDRMKDAFATPFWPAYTPPALKEKFHPYSQIVDFSHEREWRVTHDFCFEYDQIAFVVVDTYKDMAIFPKELKDSIGREKFIIMDNYKKIEELWPIHLL
ncbi:MAG: terminase [Lentisphaerae bacterium]|nr:terminase [Lentisphaerota bacterium]